MKNKIICMVSLLIVLCLLFAGCDSVSSVLAGENDKIEYSVDDGVAKVVSVPNKSTVTEIIIPDDYEGVPVTEIADFACVNLEYVTKITIGKNVKTIGNWALENDQHLTEFVIDSDNEYFCSVDGAVYSKDMKTLLFCPPTATSFKVPDGVELIRTKAFYKCTKLSTITLPDSVKSIEEKAFFRCGELKEITLPSSLTFIGKDAFSYCTGLEKIYIPNSVRQIDEYAFYNCTSLLTVDVASAEKDMQLGEKWYPTNNGLDMGVKINFAIEK